MSDLSILNAREVLLDALREDAGEGDITSNSIIPEKHTSKALIVAKGNFIAAGLPFAKSLFEMVDGSLKFRANVREGSRVTKGKILANISGRTRSILIAERTALNLLQRLSGIATLSNKFVSEVRGLKVKIADTRKTAPGLRYFDKYAVRAGGGHNHRFNLSDGVLIKDNHISASGSILKAVKLARAGTHHLVKVEVEVNSIRQVKEALSAGADILMLDNMSLKEIEKAVKFIRSIKPDTVIEASGNISLEKVREIAKTGVDIISVGAITHSAPAADISLNLSADR